LLTTKRVRCFFVFFSYTKEKAHKNGILIIIGEQWFDYSIQRGFIIIFIRFSEGKVRDLAFLYDKQDKKGFFFSF
jgi:hypothetical protein